MIALMVISGSTKSEDEEKLTSNMGAHIVEKEEDLDDRPRQSNYGKSSEHDAEENHVFAISTATIFFQALLMLSAVYYAMVCTNWGELNLFNYTAQQ